MTVRHTRYETRLIHYPQVVQWQVIEVSFSLCADEHRRTLFIGDAPTAFEAFKAAQAEINKLQRK